MKLISLLKAIMSQDMNLFVYKAKAGSSKTKKVLMPIFLALLVMYSVGMYYFGIANELAKKDLTYIILSFSIFFPSLLIFMEGIYKSPSIILEPKDNDLLLSLPIDRKLIILARLVKLYVFQVLYGTLFALPGVVIYAFFEHPGIYYYAISILMIILLPIIPTISSCIIGYLVKRFSIQFKAKKTTQTIITFAIFFVIILLSFNSESLVNNLAENAVSISNTLSLLYFPVAAYMMLYKSFSVLAVVALLGVNAVVVVLFVWIISKYYLSTISKIKENNTRTSSKKEKSFKQSSVMEALIKKELRRYFSSTVYVFNTMFGLILMLFATIYLCFNFDAATANIVGDLEAGIDASALYDIMPKLFYAMIVGMSFMVSITSSSISLEGKTFNISKGLPVKTETLLLSKIATSDIISIPFILLSDLIFFMSFKVSVLDVLMIIVISFIAPTISALHGLKINLKYPKMDASSDAEVVKQSMSSMVAVFSGMIIAAFLVGILFVAEYSPMPLGIGEMIIIEIFSLSIIGVIMWNRLKKYGEKRYKEIEV